MTLPKITHITADSRQVQAGGLFVAYRGVGVDSHRFIPQAIRNGAVAVVVEHDCDLHTLRPSVELAETDVAFIPVADGRAALGDLAATWQGHPSHQLRLVGITGTDGKTTTTNLLYEILHADQHPVSMINTVSAVIGQRSIETGLHTTTPDALDIQRYLAQMVADGSQTCLLEVTSHGIAHHRVTGCAFDVAVVTNITHEHLDAHGGSLDEYRATKAKLFTGLSRSAGKGFPKLAVLNCDDWSFDYLRPQVEAQGIRWVGYSIEQHPAATVTAHDIRYQPDSTTFEVRLTEQTSRQIDTHLVGDYNVSNVLAAVTAARYGCDTSVEAIQRGVANLRGISGRMERIDEGQVFLAMVDFAHTPNSLQRTLQAAQMLVKGRVIAVFGCAGLRDVEKRAMMGRIAAQLADYTIITAEDPRTEDVQAIIAEVAETMVAYGAVEGQTFEPIADRGRAIYRGTQLAQADDLVIALGKGHEQSMCFGTTEHPWDDRVALRTALRGQPLLTLPTATD